MAEKKQELNELQVLLQIREMLGVVTRYIQHQSEKENLFIKQIAANVQAQLEKEAAAKTPDKE